MTTYYYLLASEQFLLEEALEKEVLKERIRNYAEQKKEIDAFKDRFKTFSGTLITLTNVSLKIFTITNNAMSKINISAIMRTSDNTKYNNLELIYKVTKNNTITITLLKNI